MEDYICNYMFGKSHEHLVFLLLLLLLLLKYTFKFLGFRTNVFTVTHASCNVRVSLWSPVLLLVYVEIYDVLPIVLTNECASKRYSVRKC